MNSKIRRYAPNYCEENVWHLGQESEFASLSRNAVFVSTDLRRCRMFRQRSSASQELPVFWDYHVFLIVRHDQWLVWDLDTTLPLPTPLLQYLDSTFREIPFIPGECPRFRIVLFEEFIERFSSDRSHMRRANGTWIVPPPPWVPILNGPSNLLEFINMKSDWIGRLLDLESFRKQYST